MADSSAGYTMENLVGFGGAGTPFGSVAEVGDCLKDILRWNLGRCGEVLEEKGFGADLGDDMPLVITGVQLVMNDGRVVVKVDVLE